MGVVIGDASPAHALTCGRTVGGSFRGEDNRRIAGFVGIHVYDAGGNLIEPANCRAPGDNGTSGYGYIDVINGTPGNSCCVTLDANGASPDDTRYEATWQITNLPTNAAYVTIEAYPKAAPAETNYSRYGGAMRRMAPISNNIDLRLPVGVAYGGDNGAIGGRLLQNGVPVGIRATHAFSRAVDTPFAIMGFMSIAQPGNGQFLIPQLEPNQSYAISFELNDGRQVWYEHDYGTGLAVAARTTANYDFAIVSTPAGLRAVINEPASSGPGAVDVGFAHSIFYRRTDGSLGQRIGTSLVPLGGQILGAPDAATWFSGRLDVVARGTDNHVYLRTYDGAFWGGWIDLGGQVFDAPSIVSWGAGRLDIFAAGTDQQLWHRWTTNGTNWSHWEPLGGVLTGSVDAASWGPGRLDVVGRGTDGQVWHRYHAGSWSTWQPMGGQVRGGPAAASSGSNRLELVARGTDDRVYIRTWNGAFWSGWTWLNGGATGQDPDAFGVLGRTTVYVTGTDGFLYRATRSNGAATFAGWTSG